ncbi:hypothetical protein K438DRAFT_58718 [Mycena galopus ATCC 62051]|nr:hypothetical protein K438DRAFT_58718 [Mycena galopus ATCC 62051]
MDRDTETARSVVSDSRSIPLDLDGHLWKGKGEAVPYRTKSMSPYVLLAACGANEKAREGKRPDGTYGGQFTTALILLLQHAPLAHTTYTELIGQRELQVLPGQIPRCAGGRSNRPILNGNHPATGQHSVLLTPQKRRPHTEIRNSSQLFRVEMGTLAGVLPGTEFRAYDPNNESLCTFVAQSVMGDHSILVGNETPPVDIPRWSRAVVSDWKSPSVRIYILDDFPRKADLFPTSVGDLAKFVQAATLEEADIAVRSEGDEIVVAPLGCQRENRFALQGKPTHLPPVIHGIAHFNYFLDCDNKTDRIEGVVIEMHRLQGEYPACKPQDEDAGNIVKDGKVELVSEKGAKYGFMIRNTSAEGLFAHLFYFDQEMCTIKVSGVA